jgi:hypothetical protein
MKKIIPIIIVILIALLVVGSAAAQEPGIVTITPSTDSVTVGDPVELTVTVTHPAGTQVLMPQLEPSLGSFIVRSQSPVTTKDNGDGTVASTQIIDVRLFAPGAFETPPLVVSIADSSGQITEISAPPAAITVNSVLVEGDTALRDIKPQAALPGALTWPAVLAAIGALIATAIWFVARRVKAAFDNRLPHEAALDALTAVEKERLPENGRFQEHYTLVTDTLRAYVEQTQGIQATDRTTAEIQKELQKSSLTKEQAQQFSRILSESDLVKFAKFIPDLESAHALVSEAKQFVEATKPEPIAEDKKAQKSAAHLRITHHASRPTEARP